MRVCHFYNWGYFAPISAGADVIASNQMEYFHHKGWEVDCLLLANSERSHQAEAFRKRYSWVRSVQLVVPPPAWEWSFRGQLSCYSQIARYDGFRKLVREGHDLFLTNYAFTAPLVEQLPRGCKRLLEVLDLLYESFALGEQLSNPDRDALAPARDSFLRTMEMELYTLFDGILFINDHERHLVEADHRGRTHFVPPMMPWEITPDGTPLPNTSSVTDEPFDLIFVGSVAAANVRGLTAFYRQVFVPYLRKHRVRLAVMGKVCDQLDIDDWYVTKLGVVKGDLGEYYARSKVVVIPILEGSGLSIKTIESLARGRAVVTTAVGARGLTPDPDAFLQVDMVMDPSGTAGTILELLKSEPLRKRMQRSARDYYQRQFGRDRYFEAMDRVMSSIGIVA
jgi:glycosyltransferase involved in cell wall biosynthesis